MNQWAQFSQSMEMAARRESHKEVYVCDCGNTWFELVHLREYLTTPVIPGQDPAPLDADGYPFLKCGQCGLLKEHQLTITNPTNKLTKEYTDLVERLKTKKI